VTHDIAEHLDGDLRVALVGALQRATSAHVPVVYKGLHWKSGGDEELLNVRVRQLKNKRSGEAMSLITFEPVRTAAPAEAHAEVPLSDASRAQVSSLEEELRYSRENLQATIEELETSNEELQATNEELVASNEELQSTNQELHAVNEELYTVNAEYQRKLAELQELTADVDHMLASADVQTLFLDHELRIRRFTPRFGEMFSLVHHDVGRRIDSFSHRLARGNLARDIEGVFTTGEPFEETVADVDGRWFLLRILPYRRTGTIQGTVLTLIDIDRLRRAELEARRADAQLSSILRNSPHHVFIRDAEGRYLLADDSFRRAVGRDPVGRRPSELFSPRVAGAYTERDEAVLREGTTVETEVTLETPEGARTYLSHRFPLRDADGAIHGIAGIDTDVTRLKDAERRAHEAVEARDRFLAMLSHELRNPLATVLNAATLALREPDGPSPGRLPELVTNRVRHMAKLLDNLLDVSRIRQDKLLVERAPMDLARLLSEVGASLEPRASEKHVRLELSLGDQPVLVDGDRTRLEQVFSNLLANGVRYTPPGGQVALSLSASEGRAVVRVKDSGEGIAPEVRARIFEPFFQAHAPGARGTDSGLGLGLAVARSIVELHGGHIRVESAGVGRGSEFIVDVPISTSSLEEEPASAVPMPPPGLRVLLVEDEDDSRRTLASILRGDGLFVVAAATGEAGVEAAAKDDFDVAVLDIGLPGMSGYEACAKIRALWQGKDVAMVALTGFGQASDRAAATKAGFDAHLTKPIELDELYQTLTSLSRRTSTRGAP